MELSPILLFTYDRPEHLKNTVEALLQNKPAEKSELFIFSDGSKNEETSGKVKAVRDYLKTITGFKKVHIIERKKNYGLGKNIITGVDQIVNQFGKVIVLEDDLLTSHYFLDYMNQGLTIYEQHLNVICIHGYLYPVKEKLPETFFIKKADCLGWGTWKRAWDLFESDGTVLLKKLIETNQVHSFDFNGSYPFTQMLKDQIEGKNSSWAIRWYASAFLSDKYTLYPGKSMIYHAGNDGSGTNTGFDSMLDTRLNEMPVHVTEINVEQNMQAYDAFAKFYKKLAYPTFLYRIKRKINKYYHRLK